MNELRQNDSLYYVPPPSSYPIMLNLGLFILTLGCVLKITSIASGAIPILLGIVVASYAAFGWLGKVICESEGGSYHPSEDRSFRIGMAYFVVAEAVFLGAFLMALVYLRIFSLPALASMDPHFTLWPDFKGAWPSGGPRSQTFTPLNAWGLPAVNVLVILASAISLTWARKGIVTGSRGQMISGLAITIVLSMVFLFQQALEYKHAAELGVTLATGIYGTNFYTLSSVHGAHVLAGAIMLVVLLLRAFHGHFKPESHAGLDLMAWYWRFTVVIPGLLVFVYFYWV